MTQRLTKCLILFLGLSLLVLAGSPLHAGSEDVEVSMFAVDSESGETLDGTFSAHFCFLESASETTCLYEEDQTLSFDDGIARTNVPLESLADDLPDSLVLKTTIDYAGGQEFSLDMQAVPWAIRANVCEVANTVASDGVTSAMIAPGTIASSDLANSGVTAGTYTNATVTVNSQGLVTSASTGAAGSGGDITAVTAGTGLTGGGTSGDVTLSVTVGATIESADITDATITAADLGTDSVAADEITAGAVGTSEIADNSVTGTDVDESSLVLTGLVDDDDLAAGAVDGGTGGEIADDTLDFVDFEDTLDIDDTLTVNFTGTTTTGVTYNATSLVSGGVGLVASIVNSPTTNVSVSGININLNNSQSAVANTTTAGYNGILFGLTQNQTTSTTNESIVRVQLVQNDSGTSDDNVAVGLRVTNEDTATGDQQTLDNAVLIEATVDGTITDGIDASDAEITNAINVGANTITGTSATIDFTNFDVLGTGAVTAIGGVTAASLNLGTTTITDHLSGTATNLVSPNIGGTSCADYGSITVTGASVGDTVYASPDAASSASGIEDVGLIWNAVVTGVNTVTIRACNATGLAVDAGDDQEWRADVWKH